MVSSYNHLISLLSSPRPNEEIQSELVEVLGFEGQGLQLVEELLKPGARELMLEFSRNNDSEMPNEKVSD